MLLEGKNAVIYGGGGSIGGAVARAFARKGATVFLTTFLTTRAVARHMMQQRSGVPTAINISAGAIVD